LGAGEGEELSRRGRFYVIRNDGGGLDLDLAACSISVATSTMVMVG
jgi:hypothetical protein